MIRNFLSICSLLNIIFALHIAFLFMENELIQFKAPPYERKMDKLQKRHFYQLSTLRTRTTSDKNLFYVLVTYEFITQTQKSCR